MATAGRYTWSSGLTDFDTTRYVPVPADHLLLDDLYKEAAKRAKGVETIYHTVYLIADKFGSQLASRWESLDRTERETILDSTWPSGPQKIPLRPRPDFEDLRNDEADVDQVIRQQRFTYLCLHINVESLMEGNKFLEFFYNRATNHPSVFALTDLEYSHVNMSMYREQKAFQQVKMLLWEQKGGDYGKIVPNNEARGAFGLMPAYGLLTLEVQINTLQYLYNCCKQVLPNEAWNFRSDVLMQLRSDPMSKPNTVGAPEWPSQAEMSAKTPFRVPQDFDIANAIIVVDSNLSQIKQHNLDLQEDPNYFEEHLRETADMHKTWLQYKKKSDKVHVWDTAAGLLLGSAYYDVLYWAAMQGLLLKVFEVERRDHETDKLAALSDGCQEAFQELQYVLEFIVDLYISILRIAVPNMPSMQKAYTNRPGKNDRQQEAWQIDGALVRDDCPADLRRIHRLFRLLSGDDLRQAHGLHNIVEFGQIMITSDQAGPKHILRPVISLFTRLSMTSELRRQIRLYQPFATAWNSKTWKACVKHCSFLQSTDNNIRRTITAYCAKQKLDPDTKSFQYPGTSDPRPEKVRKDLRRLAQNKLDPFWEGVHEALGHGASDAGDGDGDTEASLRDLYKMRAFWLGGARVVSPASKSPPSSPSATESTEQADVPKERRNERSCSSDIESTSGSREEPSADVSASDETQEESITGDKPTKELSAGEEVTSALPHRFKPEGKSKKRKRRHRDIDTLAEPFPAEIGLGNPEPNAELLPIPVNGRVFSFFDAIFKIDPGQKAGTVPFNDLLYAMNHIGFAVEHIRDNFWSFRKPGLWPSSVHSPHPDRTCLSQKQSVLDAVWAAPTDMMRARSILIDEQ